MSEDQIPELMELKNRAGWNQIEADWSRFINLNPRGCFIARINREIIGCVTSSIYNDNLAWIGMMLVDEKYRRQGIGKALMQMVIHKLD